MDIAKYMTVEEAAELWKVRPERIIYSCECGAIEGAAKLSEQWIIPADILRPKIQFLPPRQTTNRNGDRTAKQQALIDAFNGDTIPFDVSENIINGITYIVTSCYTKKTRLTQEEKLYSWLLRRLEDEGYLHLSASEHDEFISSIRKSEIENQPILSEYLKRVEKALIKMEFCEEDISMLLGKYTEVYKPLPPL